MTNRKETLLQKIEQLSGGTCYQTERFTLDHFISPEYQDKDEDFAGEKIFESDKNNRQARKVQIRDDLPSLFKYFLDGSRRVYKIADFGTTDGKYLPIVAGQLGAAVCSRSERRIKKYQLVRKNALVLPDRIQEDCFQDIQQEIPKTIKKYNLSIDCVLKYKTEPKFDRYYENRATAVIQNQMMNTEVELIRKIVKILTTDKMLVVDGSLQFSGLEDKVGLFENVIGISKNFNPNLQGMLQSKNKHIGEYLTMLRYGERTPVFLYEPNNRSKRKKVKIGAWYLRIREQMPGMKPLDGIIKIEKIATKRSEKENNEGFDTDQINQISSSIMMERNVTCYGNDDRWANHLYPVYLTELFLKSNFVSDIYFLSIF